MTIPADDPHAETGNEQPWNTDHWNRLYRETVRVGDCRVGGWSAFFAHQALRALAWVTAVLATLFLHSGGGGLSTGEKEDRSNRWVLGGLGGFSVIALLMAYFSAYTDRVGYAVRSSWS